MEQTQTKLTRTQSSLLRCSSPTAITTTSRSSIHSLSCSVNEQDFLSNNRGNSKRRKIKNKRNKYKLKIKPGSIRFAVGPVFGFLCSLLLCFYFIGTRVTAVSSENLLVVLAFLAVVLYFLNRNKLLIQRTVSVLKHAIDGNLKRLGFSSRGSEKPVQWFIGDGGVASKQDCSDNCGGIEGEIEQYETKVKKI